MAVAPGTLLGRYHIISPLGAGGMGEVYLAQDTQLGRRVAIKFPTVKSDAHHAHARFLREARSVSVLSHRNIATLYDYGEKDGQPFLVMELVSGESLSDLMYSNSLTLARSVEIIICIAEALSEAHRMGIIHRDIKPSNVMINERGEVKVLDFGLAKQLGEEQADVVNQDADTLLATRTQSGMVVGTPLYLSPEQAKSEPVDVRSDIFALGTLLYECITGRSAFFGKGIIEISAKIIHVDPPAPSTINSHVPPELDHITLKALAKEPDERYQSIEEMLGELREAHASLNEDDEHRTQTVIKVQKTAQTSALTTISEGLRRPRLSLAFFLLAVAIAIIGLIVYNSVSKPKLHTPSAEAQRLYDRGVEAMREGAYYQASAAFEQAIAADNQFALAHARLAEAWIELDYIDRAKTELLLVTQLLPDRSILPDKDRLYLDAVIATVGRDFPQAVKSYTEISQLLPKQPQAFVDLGRAYENNEETKNAIDSYLKATSLDQQYATAYLRVGILYGRQQQMPSAESAFNTAENLYRAFSNFEGITEVMYQRGSLLNKNEKVEQARTELQNAFDITQTTKSLYQQINILIQLSSVAYTAGNISEAQKHANEAIKLARNNNLENLTAEALINIGNAFFSNGSHNEAEQYFTQAIDFAQRHTARRSEAKALLSMGSLRSQQGKVEDAMSYVNRALPFYREGNYRREIVKAMLVVARVTAQKGDYAGALGIYEQQLPAAEQLGDQSQISLVRAEMATVLVILEKYPEALFNLEESYKINKALGNQAYLPYDLLERGNVLWQIGRYQDASAVFSESRSIAERSDTDNKLLLASLHLGAAQMNLSERKFQDSIKECLQALNLAGDEHPQITVQALYTLGWAQTLSGLVKEGRVSCQKAAAQVESLNDAKIKAMVQIALAENLLEGKESEQALRTALQAQQSFAQLGQQTMEWRAWLIAARVVKLSDETKAQEYALNARNRLSALEQKIGFDSYQKYLNRADVLHLLKQLGELAPISNQVFPPNLKRRQP